MKYPPVLIGSKALSYYIPETKVNDIDFLYPDKSFKPKDFNKKVECHWDEEMSLIVERAIDLDIKVEGYLIAGLDDLYTLKISHMPFNKLKWERHLGQIWLMKNIGASIDRQLHSHLWGIWERRFSSKRHINFNKDVKSFFNIGPNHYEEHEKIHQKVMFYNQPLHYEIRKDKEKALCSEELFLGLNQEDRIKLAVEEVLVISIERRISIYNSFKKIVMGMCKGWFNVFLLEYGNEILNLAVKHYGLLKVDK